MEIDIQISHDDKKIRYAINNVQLW